MKAALLDLVLDIAAALLALIAQHLGQHPLQGVVTDILGYRMVAVIADVEGGTEEVARALGGVLVVTLQLRDIVHGTQHTRNDELALEPCPLQSFL